MPVCITLPLIVDCMLSLLGLFETFLIVLDGEDEVVCGGCERAGDDPE